MRRFLALLLMPLGTAARAARRVGHVADDREEAA